MTFSEFIGALFTAIGVIIIILFTALVAIFSIETVMYPLSKTKCAEAWHPRMTQYDIFNGCLVAYEGNWVPDQNYMVVEQESTVSAKIR